MSTITPEPDVVTDGTIEMDTALNFGGYEDRDFEEEDRLRHSVPRKPKCGKNYWQLTRSSKNHRKFTENSPPGGEYRGICGFLQMLQQGPGIARRADRVGVLPLAPLASFALKNYLWKLNFFHLWAHCVPG